jgi:phosphoglycolate phosphatase
MTYKGIIFDLDGTLVNSIYDIGDAMNTVLEDQGYPTHDYNAYKTFVGSGISSLVIKALTEKRTEAEINLCFEAMKKVYSVNCTNKTEAYPGIHDLLEKLKTKGIKLSVLSNKADVLTKKVVSHVFSNDFEVVEGLTTEALKKPNPEVALRMSKTMNIAPESIIFVGDSGADIVTAKKANMLAVGVSWGYRTQEDLINNGAAHILNKPLDLLELLK